MVTVEDGVRRGSAGTAIAAARIEEAQAWGSRAPSVLTLGLPHAYIPHGHVDSILSELGLDAHGLAASVLAAVETRQVVGGR